MDDVWIHELDGIRPKTYVVMVNGKVFDTLFLRTGHPLTWSQQADMVAEYREALEGYNGPRSNKARC